MHTRDAVTPELTMPTSLEMHMIPIHRTRFYFVRHARPSPTSAECAAGASGLAHAKIGREQALASAERIRDDKIEVGLIVCSG